jgi:DNA-directed RNA polymerase specialized sigma24 family protein
MTPRPDLIEHIPRLRRYARALTRDAARADDLVQDTLERALAKLDLWRPGTDLRAWLFTLMHHLFLNQQRNRPPEETPSTAAEEGCHPGRANDRPGAGEPAGLECDTSTSGTGLLRRR